MWVVVSVVNWVLVGLASQARTNLNVNSWRRCRLVDTLDIPVASMIKSLLPQVGKSHQLSERGVAALSSILTGKQSSENCEQVLVLLSILFGITENTTSGDVLTMGMYRAEDLCHEFGVDETVFKETVGRFARLAKESRSRNPLAF